MTVEETFFATLGPLAGNRCYPDTAPNGAARPYMTYIQIGGRAENFLESEPVGKRNGRFQINCWADTRAAAIALARSVEDTLVSSSLQAFVLGAPSAEYDDVVRLYGTRQDFSVWF